MDDFLSPEDREMADGVTTIAFPAIRPRPGDGAEDLVAEPFEWCDPKEIPPRRWLMGTTAIREFVTLLVSPGGVGKTTVLVTMGLAAATGRPLLGDHVFERCGAWILNLEDPKEEMQRRLTAAMIFHGIRPEDVKGRLFLNSGRDRRLVMATMASSHDGQPNHIAYPDKERVVAEIRRRGIGLLMVDPFIHSHELDENSNPHMAAAARVWAEVAAETGCAVILVHHTRKGSAGQAGDIEGARGGKALADATRVGLTLTGMAPEEAERCGVPLAERKHYVRLDDAKQSMAPLADRARWFRLASVSLGNTSATYPNGDHVQAIAPWTPPSPLAGVPVEQLNAALDRIDAGPGDGRLYGATRRGDSDRWAGSVLMTAFDCNEEQAKGILATWLQSGLLRKDTYRNNDKGRDETGLRVDPTKRPGMEVQR